MHFITALIASSATLIAAAPAPAPIHVGLDDVILHGNGRFAVMKRSEVEEIQAMRNSAIVPPKPNELEASLKFFAGNETNQSPERLSERDGNTLIIPEPPMRFLGWDVLMSQVVIGGPLNTRITVVTGRSMTNSIAVGMSSDVTLVADFLTVSTHIDYTTSWEENSSQQFSAEVPAGKVGAWVGNPWTNRQTGNVWRGKIGESGELSYYQADSFESKSYNDLSWVDGIVSLCVKDKAPLTRCIGEGEL
ncbi:hypothetical protein J1614_008236 [Plenodomus biglobosus]|nr:hypothetical protein J1614_008236 [Plenodomus biglobosus]